VSLAIDIHQDIEREKNTINQNKAKQGDLRQKLRSMPETFLFNGHLK